MPSLTSRIRYKPPTPPHSNNNTPVTPRATQSSDRLPPGRASAWPCGGPPAAPACFTRGTASSVSAACRHAALPPPPARAAASRRRSSSAAPRPFRRLGAGRGFGLLLLPRPLSGFLLLPSCPFRLVPICLSASIRCHPSSNSFAASAPSHGRSGRCRPPASAPAAHPATPATSPRSVLGPRARPLVAIASGPSASRTAPRPAHTRRRPASGSRWSPPAPGSCSPACPDAAAPGCPPASAGSARPASAPAPGRLTLARPCARRKQDVARLHVAVDRIHARGARPAPAPPPARSARPRPPPCKPSGFPDAGPAGRPGSRPARIPSPATSSVALAPGNRIPGSDAGGA